MFNNEDGTSNNINDTILKFYEKVEEENKHLGLSLIMYADPHIKFVSSLLNMLKNKHLLGKFLVDFYYFDLMLLSKSDKVNLFEELTDELLQQVDKRIDSYRLKKINHSNSNINTNEMRYNHYYYHFYYHYYYYYYYYYYHYYYYYCSDL